MVMNRNDLNRHITGNWGEDAFKLTCVACGKAFHEDDCSKGYDDELDLMYIYCPYCGAEL
jgi:DNA-directed RNA polymerase subunit RPC12/RpoP